MRQAQRKRPSQEKAAGATNGRAMLTLRLALLLGVVLALVVFGNSGCNSDGSGLSSEANSPSTKSPTKKTIATRSRTEQDPFIIPEHERSIAHILAQQSGLKYRPLRSLAEAQQVPDGRVIFEGDSGGQVYLTCPASMVKCSQEVLHRLLSDIDARCWGCNKGDGAGVYFERMPVGDEVPGGMDGGIVTDGLWLHRQIESPDLRTQIAEILAGNRERLKYRPLRSLAEAQEVPDGRVIFDGDWGRTGVPDLPRKHGEVF